MQFSSFIWRMLLVAPAVLVASAYLAFFERRVVLKLPVALHPRYGLLWPLVALWLRLCDTQRQALITRSVRTLAPLGLALVLLWVATALLPMTAVQIAANSWGDPLPLSLFLAVLSSAWPVWRGSHREQADGLGLPGSPAAYALPVALSCLGVVLLAGSTRLSVILAQQGSLGPWIIYQPLGALCLAASLAALGRRLPLLMDQPQPLALDFHLQHAGTVLALEHLIEQLQLVYSAALLVTLFLAGPVGPWLPGWLWFAAKTALVALALVAFRDRWLFPRWIALGQRLWLAALALSLFNVILVAAFTGVPR